MQKYIFERQETNIFGLFWNIYLFAFETLCYSAEAMCLKEIWVMWDLRYQSIKAFDDMSNKFSSLFSSSHYFFTSSLWRNLNIFICFSYFLHLRSFTFLYRRFTQNIFFIQYCISKEKFPFSSYYCYWFFCCVNKVPVGISSNETKWNDIEITFEKIGERREK